MPVNTEEECTGPGRNQLYCYWNRMQGALHIGSIGFHCADQGKYASDIDIDNLFYLVRTYHVLLPIYMKGNAFIIQDSSSYDMVQVILAMCPVFTMYCADLFEALNQVK